jgi:hypothetical protein
MVKRLTPLGATVHVNIGAKMRKDYMVGYQDEYRPSLPTMKKAKKSKLPLLVTTT